MVSSFSGESFWSEVNKIFNKIINIEDKFWVPFRKEDKKYTER